MGTSPPQASRAPSGEADPPGGALAQSLVSAVDRQVGALQQVSLLFSGGLDSSLLALLLGARAQRGDLRVELVTVGIAGSSDLRQAADTAEILHLPWKGVEIAPSEAQRMARHVHELLGRTGVPVHAMELEIQTGLTLGLSSSSYPHVVCGQGADELFLGYAHFSTLTGEDLQRRYEADLDRLLRSDLPETERMAHHAGRSLLAPYLDRVWVEDVQRIPLEVRRTGGPKGLLRKIAHELGLPEEIARRPKKALQYGSGVHRALRADDGPKGARPRGD